jgi:hypothetical protein
LPVVEKSRSAAFTTSYFSKLKVPRTLNRSLARSPKPKPPEALATVPPFFCGCS